MAEDKPMTVRERMAALARASAGGSSDESLRTAPPLHPVTAPAKPVRPLESAAPTPAPPKTVGPSTGLSVAERLAKMRGGQGGAASSPGESPHAKKPGPVRSFEPPTSAPTIVTQGQAGGRGPSRSGGGSSIAAKIAALSGGVKSSILPPSPSGAPTCSSATTPVLVKDVSEGGGNEAAVSPRMSAGLAGRVEAMERTASTSSDVSGEQKDAAAAVAAGASTPRPTPGTISPGLASRMKSMNLGSDATGDGGKATAHSAGGTNALSAPPASESSISSPAVTTKMSPGLAARMGKAVPIPMPGGAMPVGGLAELKLRNQENSRTQGAEAETVDEQKPAETEVEHKPGEMTHANLSRAAIPQGRRPRKTVRPFKVPAPLEATEISGEGGDGAPSKSPGAFDTPVVAPIATEAESAPASSAQPVTSSLTSIAGATGLTEIGERNSAAEAPPTRNAAASSSVEDGTGGEGATVVAVEAAQPTALLEDNGPTSRKESMSEAASSGVDEDEIGDDDGWAAEEAEPTASGEQAAAEASSMRATAVLPSVENATEDKGATAAAAEAAQPTALGKNKDFSTKMESMLEAASLGVDEDKDGEEDEWAAEEANVTALGEQDNADEASTTAAAATVPSEEDATSDNSATGATTEAAEPMAPGEKAAEELPTTSAAAVPSAGDATKDEDATSPAAEGAEWTVLGGQGNAAEASPTTATAASPSGENTPEDNDASDSNDAGGGDDTAGDKDATAAEAKAPDPNAHGKQDKPAEASPATAAAPSAENATEDKDAAEDKDAPGAAAEMAEPAAPGVRDDAADAWPRIAADAAPTPAPTPAPSKTASSISAGISVAERLAKLRAGLGGAAPSPSSSTTRAKMPGHVRRFTPPTSAPTIFTQSPAGDLGPSRSGGGSSIAAKIAALSGSVKSSVLPPSPSGAPTGSSATTPVLVKDVSEGRGNEQMPDDPSKAAVSSRVSVGWAGRVEAMERTASTSSDASGEQKDTAAAVAAGASTPRPTPGTISPGLAARLKVMNRGSDATGDGGKATADSVDGTEALRTRPVLATKMSPGLAARMGKAIPIHLPGGAMPTGGLAELKRRKQEKERAQGAGADAAEEQKPAETEVEQKPGELKHANLARATISQRRRPRKAVRRFKMNASVEARETVGGAGGAGGGEPPPVIAETKPPSLVDRPVVAPIATNQDAESANASSAEPVVASLATAAAMPSAEDATEGKGTTAVSAQEADRTVLGENGDPASRMKSLLEAASLGVAGDEDGDEDEWTE